MVSRRFGKVLVTVLLPILAQTLGSKLNSSEEHEKGKENDRPKGQKLQNKKVEDFLYKVLRKEGRIVHPNCPYEFYVKKIRGRKLLDIEFRHRDPTGKAYDLVGRASEAEFSVAEGQAFVEVSKCRGYMEDLQFWLDEKTFPIDLPSQFVPFRNLPKKQHPELPSWLTPEAKTFLARETPEPDESAVELKLKKVFGDACQEAKRSIQMYISNRGLLLAAEMFEPEPDGRIKLTPFSMVQFGKPKRDGEQPTVTTFRSDYAYFTLDRPISSMAELGNRKFSVELAGGLRLTIPDQEKK